ncbi:hypothetical protein I4U23_021355 [Adineta vaga]|nr:hypothetical protein I4U23_021355 [Adineta vaga]
MKYSLRKSFNSRRRKDIRNDDQINPRSDHPTGSNSNSNLVKSNQSKSFLRRRRRYSASPPRPSSPIIMKTKTIEHPYNNHINDDDDDDPFSSSTNSNARIHPFNKLTDQIRKSFRNTLTRQRPRLESNNSSKRLIFNTNDENRPVNLLTSSITTGLTSPITLPTEKTTTTTTTTTNPSDNIKPPPKRRKAPLAPTHMNQSRSVPNPDCSTLNITDQQESGYVSSSNDSQSKKNKFNRSFRVQISLLFKKRHAKQQQQQQQIQNSLDEDLDHQPYDDQDDFPLKKQTLGQRFDTLRRSLHLGNRNSLNKGKGYLLSNE